MMDKEYYIGHIVTQRSFMSNPIYKALPSNTDQKVFQNLRKLVDKYFSNPRRKRKCFEQYLENFRILMYN